MMAERDDEMFASLVDALGPYRDRVVIVGGWGPPAIPASSAGATPVVSAIE